MYMIFIKEITVGNVSNVPRYCVVYLTHTSDDLVYNDKRSQNNEFFNFNCLHDLDENSNFLSGLKI